MKISMKSVALAAAITGCAIRATGAQSPTEVETIFKGLAPSQALESEELCNVCQAATNLVDKELALGSKVWSDVRDKVLGECDNISIDLVQSECNYIMNKLDQIAVLVEQKLEPKDVCQKVHLCETDNLVAVASYDLPKEICDGCQSLQFMADSVVHKLLVPYAKQLSLLEQHCGSFPQDSVLQKFCENYFTVSHDAVVHFISTIEHTDACSSVLQCDPATFVSSSKNLRGSEYPEMPKFLCKACDKVNNLVKGFLQSFVDSWPETKAQVEAQCEQLGDKAEACKQGLAQLDEIVSTLKEQLPSLNICEKFHCESSMSFLEGMDSHLQAQTQSGGRHLASIDVAESLICSSCEQNTAMLKQMLKRIQEDWPQVRHDFVEGCQDHFGADGAALCSKIAVFIDDFVPKLDDYLAPALNVCEGIGCEKFEVAIDEPVLAVEPATPEIVCESCDKLQEFVHTIGENAQSVLPSIREQLLAVCDNLGNQKLVDACNKSLDQLSAIIKAVDEKLMHATLCEPIGCDAPTEFPLARTSLDAATPSAICQACEVGVNLLDSLVESLEEQWPTYRDDLLAKCGDAGDDNVVALCKDGVQDLDMIVTALKKQVEDLNLCESLQCEAAQIV